MRNFIVLLFIGLMVGCSTTPMRGTVENGKYTNVLRTFEMGIPNFSDSKIIDGSKQYYSYVDFIAETKAYSIEVFDRAGPDSEESFKAGTESFMESYIPNKCGPKSFDSVTGQFSKVSNKVSYDFITKGMRPNGQKTFWYGRSIYMAPKKVAICMYYEDRIEDESVEEFKAKFNQAKFDQVCSSIEIKI